MWFFPEPGMSPKRNESRVADGAVVNAILLRAAAVILFVPHN